MRLVTWNMGCGPRTRYRRTHEDAWNYLLCDLGADVALVQEALFASEDFAELDGDIVWSVDHGRDSGAGIFLRTGVTHQSLTVQAKGSYIAGVTVSILGHDTDIYSVHVGPPKYRDHLVALRSWLESRMQGESQLIVGGDLNSSRQFNSWHSDYLGSLSALGLHDCHWEFHGAEAHSFWGHQARHLTLQDDHLFTCQALAPLVKSCEVVKNEQTMKLSDHGPVVLEIS